LYGLPLEVKLLAAQVADLSQSTLHYLLQTFLAPEPVLPLFS